MNERSLFLEALAKAPVDREAFLDRVVDRPEADRQQATAARGVDRDGSDSQG